MSERPELSGVGGWLRFLIVMMTILSPLWGWGVITRDIQSTERLYPALLASSAWFQYKQLSWCVFAVTAAMYFAAGYRLWKSPVRESVRFAILVLWLASPLGNVARGIVVLVTFGTATAGAMLPRLVKAAVASAIGAAIWTTYLLRSSRVRNTYLVTPSATRKPLSTN